MRIGSCVIAVLLAATSVLAHHSNSAFDDKVMVLTGTVTEWKWTNPHVWIFLSVDDGNGSKVRWEIEGRTPGQLVRAGWSRTTLKAGETIAVDFSRISPTNASVPDPNRENPGVERTCHAARTLVAVPTEGSARIRSRDL